MATLPSAIGDVQNPFAGSRPFAALLTMDISVGDKLYDDLMSRIEPELTTGQIPLLAERYKNEGKEDAAKRKDRYQKAFAEYDKRLQEYMGDVQRTSAQHRRDAMRSAEQQARTQEDFVMSDLESRISQL